MINTARPGFDPGIFPIKRKIPIVGKADRRTWDLVPVWVVVQYRDFLVYQVVPDAGFYVNAFQIFCYWFERKRQHEASIMSTKLTADPFLEDYLLTPKVQTIEFNFSAVLPAVYAINGFTLEKFVILR